MAAGKKTAAVSLADFINIDRERKKNEVLAAKVFGKGRRNSAPGAAASGVSRKGGAGPSLASRVGVQKQRSVSTAVARQRGSKPAGNVDVEWTHDLHSLNNPTASRVSQLPHNNSRGGRGQARNGQRLLAALNSSTTGNTQFNVVNKPKPTFGMSIRGLAGPYTVVAKNFAPGTTEADIESAMAPIGGEIRSCSIVSTHPTTAEIVFESKEGADNVIETFNNQTADGRLLSVYSKPTPLSQPIPQPAMPVVEKLRTAPTTRPSPPTGPRANINSDRGSGRLADHYHPRERSRERRRSFDEDAVMDGSYGFEEKMDIDDGNDGGGRGRGLYSDDLVGSRSNGRGGGDSRDGGRGRDRGRRYR